MSTALEFLRGSFQDWAEEVIPAGDVRTLLVEKHITSVFHDIKPENSLLVLSVCPDDINRNSDRQTVEGQLKSVFNGEFHLGGLAGFPFAGIAGISAASHHPPDFISDDGSSRDSGNLVILILPHLGLNSEFKFGKVRRPGQVKYTNSCGAMAGFLKTLTMAGSPENIKVPPFSSKEFLMNPSFNILVREFVEAFPSELAAIYEENEEEKIISLSKLNYRLNMDKCLELLENFGENNNFLGEIVVAGGIVVNTEFEDFLLLKDVKKLARRGTTLKG